MWGLSIVNCQETTLAANQPVDAKRTRLNGENLKDRNTCRPETEMFEEAENSGQPEDEMFEEAKNSGQPECDQQVNQATVAPLINLEPLQIRTFIATVSWY